MGVPTATKTILKGTAIAGNVITTLTVGTGERWKLTNINITLTTDVTVANRFCRVTTQDVANDIIFRNQGSAITASSTESRYFNPNLTANNQIYNALGEQILEVGEDVLLNITNGVAGDAYDYLVEYLVIRV